MDLDEYLPQTRPPSPASSPTRRSPPPSCSPSPGSAPTRSTRSSTRSSGRCTEVADARAAEAARGPLRRGAVPGQGPRPGVRRLPHHQGLPLARARRGRPSTRWSRSASSTPGWSSSARRTPRSSAPRASPRTRSSGRARNPWNLNHTPGGSSGGSGAAVARRHRPGGGGQRRRRLGPHPGGVQRPGRAQAQPRAHAVRPPGQRVDVRHGHAGRGLAHGARQRGPGRRDRRRARRATRRTSPSKPDPFLPSLDERPGKLRIGYSASSAINANPDPEAIAAVEKAAALLTELGHEVEEVKPPHDDEALARDFLTIWFAQLHGQISGIKERLGASRQRSSPPTRSPSPRSVAPPASARSSTRWTASTTTSTRSTTSTRATTSSSPRPWPSRRSRSARSHTPLRCRRRHA